MRARTIAAAVAPLIVVVNPNVAAKTLQDRIALAKAQPGKLDYASATHAPDVPTVAESGYPGFEASSWYSLLAPAGSPASVVVELNREVNRVLREAGVRARFSGLGVDPLGGSVADADAFLRAEIAKWSKLIREKNLAQS